MSDTHGESWWDAVVIMIAIVFVILGVTAAVVWNGYSDRLSKERIGRDCIAAGGTWVNDDCIKTGTP